MKSENFREIGNEEYKRQLLMSKELNRVFEGISSDQETGEN